MLESVDRQMKHEKIWPCTFRSGVQKQQKPLSVSLFLRYGLIFVVVVIVIFWWGFFGWQVSFKLSNGEHFESTLSLKSTRLYTSKSHAENLRGLALFKSSFPF